MRRTTWIRSLTALLVAAPLIGCGASRPAGETSAEPRAEAAAEPQTSAPTTIARARRPAPAPTAPPEEPYDPLATPQDVASPPADAERTRSGLASKVLRQGSGRVRPDATTEVTVHYSGWTTDGEMFDSSHRRGRPATFPLDRVIQGWTEGLQLMVAGERRRLWIPEDLAYGGRPGRPQGMLVFDVELLGIDKQ